MSKDHYPSASRNQSVPAFAEATRENRQKNEAPGLLGTAQKSTGGHPDHREQGNGGKDPAEGCREEAHRKESHEATNSQMLDDIQPARASWKHVSPPKP